MPCALDVQRLCVRAREFELPQPASDVFLKASALVRRNLPRVLEDVTCAVINTNFAGEAGLIPSRDALGIESSDSPFANIVVVREADKDSPAAKALVKAMQSPEVKTFIQKELLAKGIVPAF